MSDSFEGLAPFGSDRIEARGADEIALRCALSKGWNPRRVGSQTRASHPGTTVRWGGRLFEVVAIEPLPGGSLRYRLSPWPDTQTIRTIEAYDQPSEASRSADRSERSRDLRRRRLAILLAPLAGLLPGEVQWRMEKDFGAPARAMTILSALPLLALGVAGSLLAVAASLGGGQSDSTSGSGGFRLPLPLGVYLIAESALRLASAVLQNRPMGTLVTEVGWRLLFRDNRPRPPVDQVRLDATARRDRFLMLEAVLALLSPAEQQRLQAEFGFDPIRWGRRTAWLLGLVGGANAMVAILNAAAGSAGAADVLWFLAGSSLAAEQVVRLRRLREGRPAGSALGALVRPLARPLMGPPPRLPASPS